MAGRRASTALIDDPDLPGKNDLDQDATPRKRVGRPRKATSTAAPRRPGRKPGTVQITTRGSDGRIMSKDTMKGKVSAKLGMLAAAGVAGLEMRDPEAASCFLEPIEVPGFGEVDPIAGMVGRIVEILARNEKALAFMANEGDLLVEVAGIAFIGGTIAKRLYTLSSDRRARPVADGISDDDQFPAYAGR